MIKKILFSQPRPTTEHNPYSRLAEQFGLECDFYQFIHVEGLSASEFRKQRINPLDYTAVILNSKLGAEHYFRLCEEMRLNVPDTMHYYCNSDQVGLYLQKFINYCVKVKRPCQHKSRGAPACAPPHHLYHP